jgi:hypothetical protein
LSLQEQELPGASCAYTLVRTWTALDDCGNTTTTVQEITVVDTTPPVLVGVPADATADCTAIPAQAAVVVEDNCDESPLLAFSEQIIPIDDCSYRIVRTWSAADDCQNTQSATQVITVTDLFGPVLSGSDTAITLECTDVAPVVPPTVTDNCDSSPEVVYSFQSIPGSCPNAWTEVYTWTATDNCGNVSVRTFTYNFADTTPPSINGVPADLVIDCQATPPPAFPTVSDNCDETPALSAEETYVQDDCAQLVVRTWTATDACGNTATATQTITLLDTTPPVVLYQPEDVTIQCDELAPFEEPVFADNCDASLTIEFTDNVEGNCPWYWICTWTATDDCGNATSVTRIVSIVDETAPVFEDYEVEITVGCNAASECILTATDNCDGDVYVEIFDEFISSGGCLNTVERTCIAYDDCGNSSTATQILHIVDELAPELVNIPADITIECGDQIPQVPADVTATDDCDGEVDLSFSQIQTGNDCPYDIIRTWLAVDQCLNVTEAVQVIHVLAAEPQPEQCAADFNQDGVINLLDLLVLTAAYGCVGECGLADMNTDGVVNIADFLIFTSYFGMFCD